MPKLASLLADKNLKVRLERIGHWDGEKLASPNLFVIHTSGDQLGNHWLVQRPTDAPFPTNHLQLYMTIFCAANLLFLAKEGQDPNAAPRKSLSKK